ncbi:tetratricopeptide repeat protein [Marinobacterium sp. YM272]|uniref:tetratricopeptide repeat protein n=1 Tax=Marinobacterium sp. YM272 TaxID=3421654 RepID=UPI003D7FF87E
MRTLTRWLSPVIFWIANAVFRSPLFKTSRWRHQLAMKLFRVAAESGSVRALSMYGHLLHFRGEDVSSRIQGGIYLQRAAEKGDIKALYQMGRIHESGFEHYFTVKPAQSLACYRAAAEQGHPLALKRMRAVYEEGGLGEAPDRAEAEHWRQLQEQHSPA